jgi:glycosyltransferase involved in cell wall biosynthesis
MIACSKEAGKWLFGEKAIKSEKFLILKNAIEIDKFMFDKNIRINIRKKLNLGGKYVVGHIGRFHPQKNHEFVIDVFNRFKKEKDNAVLILVGEGPKRRNIQDKVEKLGLSDSVIFLGVRSDVNEIFQGMDVFLFPSKYEGLGIVVIEAQATGLQCIVSENIPEEAVITDLVTKLPLEIPVNEWVKFMLGSIYYREINRQKYNELIRMNGYEVKSTSLELESFYLSC